MLTTPLLPPSRISFFTGSSSTDLSPFSDDICAAISSFAGEHKIRGADLERGSLPSEQLSVKSSIDLLLLDNRGRLSASSWVRPLGDRREELPRAGGTEPGCRRRVSALDAAANASGDTSGMISGERARVGDREPRATEEEAFSARSSGLCNWRCNRRAHRLRTDSKSPTRGLAKMDIRDLCSLQT